jgi:hypothetical protein
MKTFRTALIACALLAAAGIAGAQVNIPDPGAPGNSPESAVRILATSELMVDRFIQRWLRAHYPNWHHEPHEMMDIGMERYAVVFISSPDNPGRRIYFRVQSRMNEDDSAFPL